MRDPYAGEARPPSDRIIELLSPRGNSLTDGARLATINVVGMFAALVLMALVSAVSRVLSAPFILTGFAAALVMTAGAAYCWSRYARAHGDAARLRSRAVNADVFGAIAALPFGLVAVILFSFGLLGLFFSVVTFSLGRALDAFRQLGLSFFFVALAIVNVLAARFAND